MISFDVSTHLLPNDSFIEPYKQYSEITKLTTIRHRLKN